MESCPLKQITRFSIERKPTSRATSWGIKRSCKRYAVTLPHETRTVFIHRSAPAGLDRITGKRATQSRRDPAAARGTSTAGHSCRPSSGSPESLQGTGERRGTTLLGESRPEKEGNTGGQHDFSDLRPGFSGNNQPTLPSALRASPSSRDRGSKAGRQRPRTATAAGRTSAGVWRGRDFCDGFGGGFSRGSGASAANRRRPRSASSRFHTSPSRSQGRETAERVPLENGFVDESGGRETVSGGRRAESRGLPEGWAEAVDEQSGHVYYYSEKR